jgi:hypothetical protein
VVTAREFASHGADSLRVLFKHAEPDRGERPEGVYRNVFVSGGFPALKGRVDDPSEWIAVSLHESKTGEGGRLEYAVMTAAACRLAENQPESPGVYLCDVMDVDADWNTSPVRRVNMMQWPKELYRRHVEEPKKATAAIA